MEGCKWDFNDEQQMVEVSVCALKLSTKTFKSIIALIHFQIKARIKKNAVLADFIFMPEELRLTNTA